MSTDERAPDIQGSAPDLQVKRPDTEGSAPDAALPGLGPAGVIQTAPVALSGGELARLDLQVNDAFSWEAALAALCQFCRGQFRMSIPPQPTDDDLLISKAIERGEAAEARVAALEADLYRAAFVDKARAARNAALAADLDTARARVAALEAELSAVRPVIDVAEQTTDHFGTFRREMDSWEVAEYSERSGELGGALVAAVTAMRAARAALAGEEGQR